MLRAENTIYIRRRRCFGIEEWQGFVKSLGEGVIVMAACREAIIHEAGKALWVLAKFGPKGYVDKLPLVNIPGMPASFDYPVIEEEEVSNSSTDPV
jgi:hypothetical protein